MSHTSPSGVAAGSRRFWITVLAFALANVAAFFAYHEYQQSKLHLLRVVRFDPSGQTPLGPRPTLAWEFNFDVAHAAGSPVPGTLTPNVAGKWLWHDGRTLTFTPDGDLPRATRFTVTLPAERLRTAQGIRLDKTFSATFTTEPLKLLAARQAGFDPERRSIIQLEFDDVVLPADALKHLKVTDPAKKPVPFHLHGEAAGRTIGIQTEPMTQLGTLPSGSFLTVELTAGLTGASGPLGTSEAIVRQIPIAPDLMAMDAVAVNVRHGECDVQVHFNNTISTEIAAKMISIEPAMKVRISQIYDSTINLSAAGDGFEPGRRYLIKIGDPPAGADRTAYPRGDALSVFIPDRGQQVWFEHAEGYLGANGNRTLLAHVVNVKQVKATITRLYDNNLVAWRNQSPQGRWEDTTELAIPIATRTLKVAGQKNKDQDLRLSLDELLPADATRDGVYRVGLSADAENGRARRGGVDEEEVSNESASCIVTLSDIGLSARQSREAMDVWAVSLSSAKPLEGVRVRAYSNKNQLLGEGQTNLDGLLRLTALHPAAGEHVAVIVAERPEASPRLAGEAEKASHIEPQRGLTWLDLACGEVNLATQDTAGTPYLRSGFEAYVYTERGVYRPGETAHLRAIVRGPDATTPKPFPVRWQLRRPDLRDWESQVVTLDGEGLSALDIKLPDDLPTGRWTAQLQMPGDRRNKGAVFGSTAFQIEEFVPNRMKVKLEVTGEGSPANAARLSIASGPVKAAMQADYLFGQPVADRPATLTARVEPAEFSAAAYAGYIFGDAAATGEVFHGRQSIGGRTELGPITLDAKGSGKWELDEALFEATDGAESSQGGSGSSAVKNRGKHGKKKAVVVASSNGDSGKEPYLGPWRLTLYGAVIETGGRAVSASRSVEVDQLPHYLGIHARSANSIPGEAAEFDLAAVTPAGAVAEDAESVQVQLYREAWNTSLVEEQGHYHYVSTRKLDPIGNASSVRLNSGRGSCRVTPPTGGAYVLLARDTTTRYVSSYRFYCNSGAWDDNISREDPEKVEVVLAHPPLDRWQAVREAWQHPSTARVYSFWHHGTVQLPVNGAPQFHPGQEVKVLVRAPFAGRLLLSVETDSVLSTQVLEMPTSSFTTILTLPKDCRPNAFITATVLRPIDPNASWRTHRAFGLARAAIDNSDRRMTVQISAPAEVRSGYSLGIEVKVTDADGRPAANAAVTVAAVDEGILSLTNFKTPDPFAFFTSARAHGVTWADLYSELMPEVTRPRRSSETGGDKGDGAPAGRHLTPVSARRVKPVAFITGLLHTDAQGMARADFNVPEFSGQLRVMAVASGQQSFGSAQSTTLVRSSLLVQSSWPRFAAPGDRFSVPITLFNRTSEAGAAKVLLVVAGKPAMAGESVLASAPLVFGQSKESRLEVMTPVIPANGSTTINVDVTAAQVACVAQIMLNSTLNSESAQESMELPIRPASPEISVGGYATATPGHPATMPAETEFTPGTAHLQIRVGAFPQLELPRGLDYLDRYPYGCVEQTTSACFPLLALGDIGPKIAPGLFERSRVETKLQAGITTLIGMQCADGGLAMWPGGRQSWPWASVYAAHMLVEAQATGHKVPGDFRDSLTAYVRNLLNQSSDASDVVETQAYACYVLALAGNPDRAVMSRLSEIINHPRREGAVAPQARFHLAAAWLAAGRRDLAEGLIPQTLPQPRATRDLAGNVGSPVRDRAVLLSTLLDLQPDHASLPAMAQQLADAGRNGRWQSTQDTAFAVLALGKYLQKIKVGSPYETASLSIGGKTLASSSDGQTLISDPAVPPPGSTMKVEVTGSKDAKAHVAWLLSGVPIHAPLDDDAGLQIRRRYLNSHGDPIQGNRVHSGELVQVEISLSSATALENVVIDDLLPAGLEIENARLATAAEGDEVEHKKGEPRNVFAHARLDTRDDRLIIVGAMSGGGTGKFVYLTRAVKPGTFTIPPIRGECMYDIGTHSLNGAGRTLTVEPWASKAVVSVN